MPGEVFVNPLCHAGCNERNYIYASRRDCELRAVSGRQKRKKERGRILYEHSIFQLSRNLSGDLSRDKRDSRFFHPLIILLSRQVLESADSQKAARGLTKRSEHRSDNLRVLKLSFQARKNAKRSPPTGFPFESIASVHRVSARNSHFSTLLQADPRAFAATVTD